MLIVANECPSEYKIVEYKDIVFGVSNFAEGPAFREGAVKKITENAEKLGANCIVNFDLKVYSTPNNTLEASAYGNAVIADPIDGVVKYKEEKKQTKVNYEAYKKKEGTSPLGQIHEVNGYKFVVCPQCGTKYKVETDEKGEIRIKGFDDVDDIEPGLQIFCLRCGTKFTVPEK